MEIRANVIGVVWMPWDHDNRRVTSHHVHLLAYWQILWESFNPADSRNKESATVFIFNPQKRPTKIRIFILQ